MTLDGLNAADEATFVTTLGSIFENSPWVAEHAWRQRPFPDIATLHATMCSAVSAAPLAQRVALIRAHPELAAPSRRVLNLSASSAKEQTGAGLDSLEREESAMLAQLNAAYNERFDFPFVVCVRGKTAAEIIANLESRLINDRVTEIATALEEIAQIARFRLMAAITTDHSDRTAL